MFMLPNQRHISTRRVWPARVKKKEGADLTNGRRPKEAAITAAALQLQLYSRKAWRSLMCHCEGEKKSRDEPLSCPGFLLYDLESWTERCKSRSSRGCCSEDGPELSPGV